MTEKEIKKAVLHLSRQDSIISTIIKRIGNCNLLPHKQYFNALLKSIVGQQLSIKSAAAINSRLFDYFNHKPKPEEILRTPDRVLRKIGLSNAKTKYVKDLSKKVLDGEMSLRKFDAKSDEEITTELTKVKGIGEWTSHMFLIFTLGRPNVLPTGDLGIKRAIMLNYRLRKMPDEKKVAKISRKNNWQPFNSVASWYLWKSLEMDIETYQ